MKKITNALIFLCSLASICIFVKDFNVGASSRFLGDLSMIFVLLLPKIIRKIFKLKISDGIELIYVIFMILAQFVGSVVNLYNITWWYDIFAHFLSGILTSILALVIMNWFKTYKDKNRVFNFLYMISFTLMIASIWEFLEFGADKFLGMNVQHSIDTGVRDTMEDMLVAFLGALIVGVSYLTDKKNKLIEKIVNTLK